jgi:hypothetical protein
VTYADFLASKLQFKGDMGFEAELPDFLFPFQRSLVAWALKRGRAAEFVDTGLGKTPMQLVWADRVMRHTNKNVLILTPLAVAAQTIREAQKFGIEAARSSGAGINGSAHILITNYEKLHHFSPSDFGGVVCDESSAIKAFNGKHRAEVTEFMRTIPYRSLWTATAAPNDYIELGTSSEALGELGQIEMLNRFFKNDQNNSNMKREGRNGGTAVNWRFKGHAEDFFWRWVCSWARACRMPSDIGFGDNGFVLPNLIEREHIVETKTAADGFLFALPATNFREERGERRRTIEDRCELAANLINGTREPAVIWCHLNDEGDILEKAIPDCVQVSGADSDEAKEAAYMGFSDGSIRVLVIKPKIGAWGMNWQHCAHVVTFASHSYEQYYQAVRRCWRFGQKKPVTVDLIASEGEIGVKDNMRRKAEAADRMFSALVARMNDAMSIVRGMKYEKKEEAPQWLRTK